MVDPRPLDSFGCILLKGLGDCFREHLSTRVCNFLYLLFIPEGFPVALWTPSALLLKGFGNCFGDTMLLGFPISFLSCYFQRALTGRRPSPAGLLRGRLTSNIIFSRFSGGCGRGLLTQKSPPTNTFHFSRFSGRAREGAFSIKAALSQIISVVIFQFTAMGFRCIIRWDSFGMNGRGRGLPPQTLMKG